MLAPRKKILAVPGSTKRNSTNEYILKLVAGKLSDAMDMEVYDPTQLPYFNPDLTLQNTPEPVIAFRKKVEEADGVVFCTPEYVFSLPGIIKNTIEWTVATLVFTDKPTAFIIASASGEKAFESLDLVLRTIGAKMTDGTKLLIQGAKGKFNPETGYTEPETMEAIDKLAGAFRELVDSSIEVQ